MKKLLALFLALLVVASLGSSFALAMEGTYATPFTFGDDSG